MIHQQSAEVEEVEEEPLPEEEEVVVEEVSEQLIVGWRDTVRS